jgi:hypothetical protein
LQQDLARFIRQRYGVEIPPGRLAADAIPAHLRPRIEVIGNDQKIMGASRDLGALRQKLEQVKNRPRLTIPPGRARPTMGTHQYHRMEFRGFARTHHRE